MKVKFTCILLILLRLSSNAQDVSLYKQLAGHIDFTIIGNTMNYEENGEFSVCAIKTESAATLNLDPEDTILAAYLYWAGSGTGDLEVKLNEFEINSQRNFSDLLQPSNLPFFSAFYNVTDQIIASGNGTYTLSGFDLNPIIENYCPNGTNFAGWSILVVYENQNLPLNQINIYDGLEHVPTDLTIQLTNLDVIDTIDSKIGFIAWEGDGALSVNESLLINGNLIGNPPLNPTNNAFNSTDSFNGRTDLYNMDIDFYSIQNNIAIGDTKLTIQLTSGQDFVMINSIVTKLNSQLPDPTVRVDNFEITGCNELETVLDVTVHNENSTKLLPANTSISVYVDESLLETRYTTNDIPINGSESLSIPLEIPESALLNFKIKVVVNEEKPVLEISPNNNSVTFDVSYPTPPILSQQPSSLEVCNMGFETGNFDFTSIYDELMASVEENIALTFYPSEEDYLNETAPINPAFEYQNTKSPQTIFVKATNELTGCYSFTSFPISVYNCPPFIPNGFSPNNDGINDDFNITGLYDIFTDYKLEIYNRWGNIVFEGSKNSEKWNGRLYNRKKLVPAGVYFYILYLNDPNYKALQGTVYVMQ